MADLRELQKRLESIRALREIVNAMRNLAAVYVRRAEAAVQAVRPCNDIVETALGAVLANARAAGTADEALSAMVLVFGSDQGLCGTYNGRAVDAAMELRGDTGDPTHFVAIGSRAGELLRQRGIAPLLVLRAPTSIEGIRAQVNSLVTEAFEAYRETGVEQVHLVYNTYESMGRSRATVGRLLPPDFDALAEKARNAFTYEPILTAPSEELLPSFIGEFFFARFHRALLEGHASENGARLLAMTAAATNIDKRLAETTEAFQEARQEAVTAELLEIVGGAEALSP